MRINLTLLSLLFPFVLFSQTVDVSTGCAPLQVSFTPPPGASSFFWDFKDGSSSNLSNPTTIFTMPGIYAVEFRTAPGGPLLGTVNVTVWPKPDVEITATPDSGCMPLEVMFADVSVMNPAIQVLNRFWVFGDGSSASGPAAPTHTYTAAGNFTVSLELTTNYPSCNVTELFDDKITVGTQLLAAFITDPAAIIVCEPPLTVSFTNTSTGGAPPLSYAWSFGNGNTSAAQNPPAQTYDEEGEFPVTLVVTDAYGCTHSVQKTVRVGSPPALFALPDTVCLGVPVQIDNQSAGVVSAWTFGPNAAPASSMLTEPLVTFLTSGAQMVTLIASAGACSDTLTKTIWVDQADANFTVTPPYACTDPVIFTLNALSPVASAWEWLFSDGSTATGSATTFTWTTPDTTGYASLGLWSDTIQLIVANPSGCRDTLLRATTVWRPNARFMPSVQHGCAPLEVTFTDHSRSNEAIQEWTYLFDDGTPPLVLNNGAAPMHTFTAPGEYEVRLVIRNAAGCVDTSYTVLIEVGEPIMGDFSVDQTEICPGDTVHFTNLTVDTRVDGYHFYSDGDRLWHCFQEPSPSWAYITETGLHDVSLMVEYNGCFSTVTKEDLILVKGPLARLHYKTTCENTRLFEFTSESGDATAVTWTLGDSTTSTLDSLTHLYATAGTYTVVLMAENPASGCPASFDTATVYATQLVCAFALDETICAGVPYQLNGINSEDVNAVCHKGYTWFFSFQRPIRTSEPSIPFTFLPPGDQTVCLEVEDINGCRDTLCQDIAVYTRNPVFAVSDTFICLPTTVTFTDMSTATAPIVGWAWDFGDGTTGSGPTASHTFTTIPPNGQFFTVTLTITDEKGCSSSIEHLVRVYYPVSGIGMVPNPANICVGSTVAFTATDYLQGGSSLQWAWDFGTGTTASGQTVQHTFDQAGQFVVAMQYTEIGSGCSGTQAVNVTVQDFPEAAFISNVDSQSIICYPQNMVFTGTSTPGTTLVWDLGNGITAAGPSAATVFPKGTFTVSLIATTAFGCPDTVERSFTVVGPEGTFTMDKSLICRGDSITFTLQDTVDISTFSWSFGDGTTLDNMNPVTHAYLFQPPSGQTLARLILRGEDDACTFAVEKAVNFSPVKAQFNPGEPSVCLGLSHDFFNTSTAADVTQWFFGDGATSQAPQPAHLYATPGDYPVTLIVIDQPLGCADTLTRLVSVTALPDIAVFGDTICPGDTAFIGLVSPQPGYIYAWSPAGPVLPPSDSSTVQAAPSETTDFALLVTDSMGCLGFDTARVLVPQTFQGAGGLDTIVAKGEPVVLPVAYDPAYTFEWTPDPGPGLPPEVTPFDSSLLFILTVRDAFGCAGTEFTYRIRVVPESVQAPNVFTPNGDSFNDVFRLIADGEASLVMVNTLKIYNRWGQLVYQVSGDVGTVAWDGTHQGEPAPSDAYIWVATVSYLTGKQETLTGDLTLLR